jgi:hypothetical protein
MNGEEHKDILVTNDALHSKAPFSWRRRAGLAGRSIAEVGDEVKEKRD